MHCTACGVKSRGDVKFCAACGAGMGEGITVPSALSSRSSRKWSK